MAILPTRLLEWEFDAGVWTDVSADVVDYSTNRGRNRELGAFETGTGTFTLRNDGRKYDPDNTAGPYYGKLRPNRRLRFRATYNAVTYPVIVGYVDRITQQYGGPNDATALVEISDLFKILNRVELPASVFAAEIAADTPRAWWRLGEPSGSSAVYDVVTGRAATIIGTPTLGASGLITRDDDTAMATDAANEGADTGQGATIVSTYPMTFSAVVATTSGVASVIATLLDAANQRVAELRHNGTRAWFSVQTAAGVAGDVVGTVAINDGAPHLVTGVWDAAGQIHLYTDGVENGTPVTVAAPNPATRLLIAGGVDYSGPTTGLIGTIDEVAAFNTAVSAARIAAWSAARAAPWNGDLPGTRLGRIFDMAAVPAGDRNLDAGTTTLQSASLATGTALAGAQKVEETELGELFATRDGKLRFIGRDALVTGAYLTSLATLVDDDSGAGIPYRAVSSDVDEAVIVTRSTVSREGSVALTYYDAAAKAEFGWLDDTHEGLLHNSDAYSVAYAQWMVSIHKTPTSRIGAISLELTGNPATMYPAILALELGDQVTYKRKPQNTGAVITLPMRVEAVSHDTGGGYWRTRLQLSPFNLAGGVPVGVWDVSLWDQAVWGI